MRVYAMNKGKILRCKELVSDLKCRESIIEKYGEDTFFKMYISMCDSVRQVLKCDNYISIRLLTTNEANDNKLDKDIDYLVIEFDYKVDKINQKIYAVQWDEEKQNVYIEIE